MRWKIGNIGIAMAFLALSTYGLVSGLAVFLLSLIAYALSRVFDFLSDLLGAIKQDEQSQPVKDKDPA